MPKSNVKCQMSNVKRGFSIGEVMISIFIIVFGIVAALSLLTSSLKNSMDSRDQIIASQLAQEGVELVRNIRDTNWEAGRDSFEAGFPSGDDSSCAIGYEEDALDCAVSSYRIYFDADNFYSRSGTSETKFQRKIAVDYDADGNVGIISQVVWGENFPASLSDCAMGNKCIYEESFLSKWKE